MTPVLPAVALAVRVTCTDTVFTALTVVLDGMPVPVTSNPGTRPATLATATLGLLSTVVPVVTYGHVALDGTPAPVA